MLILKYILPLILLLAATSTMAQTTTSKTQTEFVMVCEVLSNRRPYDSKFVALIGRWSATDEGFWLVDDCDNPVKTGDYFWNNIVFLEYDPVSPSAFAGGPNLDNTVAKEKIAEMKGRSKDSNIQSEWVVVYGRVETKEELPIVV